MKPTEEKARKEIARTVLRRLSDGLPHGRTELFADLKPTSATWQLVFLRRLTSANIVEVLGGTFVTRRYACASLDLLKGLLGNEMALTHLLWPASGPATQEELSWVTEQLMEADSSNEDQELLETREPKESSPPLSRDEMELIQIQNLKLLTATIQNIVSLRERLDAIEKNQDETLSILRRLL